jgi:hypothetical protein
MPRVASQYRSTFLASMRRISYWRVLRARSFAVLLATILLASGLCWMLWPMLARWDTYGFHDWDLTTAYRYITRLSLVKYGELPLWNPWLGGGCPAFGSVESVPNLISPYLPFYLLLDVRSAVRIEVIGSLATAMVGAYLLARRFTSSVALAACAAAIFGLNGRTALQLATGHTWHLQFCWLPWALFAFDRAQERGHVGSAILSGAFVALTVLMGGIYPFPYTVLFLTGYAVLLAGWQKSLKPLAMLVVTGFVAAGLSAPKLLPVVDTMAIAPRHIDSNEVIGISQLGTMLTARGQRYGAFPVSVPTYNWHEWGIYVGTLPCLALVLAAIYARGPRENALRVMGIGAGLLGFGAFHPYAPWTLLHRMPVFTDLHVPSRFFIVMVLLFAILFAAWLAVPVERLLAQYPWLDLVLLLPIASLVWDLSQESQRCIGQAFWLQAPDNIIATPVFEHHKELAARYLHEDPEQQPSLLLSMIANQGAIDATPVPDRYPIYARAAEHRQYRGMVTLLRRRGRATIVDWSPNRAVVRLEGERAGDILEYNMNYDPSWRANGSPAIEHRHRVATRLKGGEATVVFEYWPRRLALGLALFLSTVVGVAAWGGRRRIALALADLFGRRPACNGG